MMSKTDILHLRENFKSASRRALEAGFEVIEIHGAHGYLINSFLSPLSNQRSDEYGGSFENRIRLLKEIVQDIRSIWPENIHSSCVFPLQITPKEAGISLCSAVTVVKKGADLIDTSEAIPRPIPLTGYQTGFWSDT
jgi:2,4-dienoyl-CoA reductase-like NADH-dependent reductase (Old Yellow Enzyme family)